MAQTGGGLDTPGFFDGTEGLTAATSAGLDGECIDVVMPLQSVLNFCQIETRFD